MRIILIALFLLLVTACGDSSTNGSSWKPTGAYLDAQNLFKGPTEPTVKDALWTSESIFKVGVIDDGSSRKGYAMYVCEVLYDFGFKGKSVWVHVIDIAKLSSSGKWVKLGEHRCS